jgi:hypothetical protein
VELIQAVSNTLYFEIHKLIHSIWNKKELPEQWKGRNLLLYQQIPSFIRRVKKLIVVIIEEYHYYQLQDLLSVFSVGVHSILKTKLLGIISVDFDVNPLKPSGNYMYHLL